MADKIQRKKENISSIIRIAENMGIEVIERKIHKEELYTSDEIFFSGTAAEITPIINVDGIDIQKQAGPITKLLSDKFNNIVHGNDKEFNNWLTLIS